MESKHWKRSMRRVLLGFTLTAVTLHVWLLQYMLPTAGMILMLLGFRALSAENRWFGGCYGIAILRVAVQILILLLNATIYAQTWSESGWMVGMTVGNLLLQFVQLLCLWQGIRAVQCRCGLEVRAGGVVGLMIWFVILCLLSVLQYSGMFFTVIAMILCLFSVYRLWKLTDEMDENGVTIDDASVHVPEIAVVGSIAVILIVGLVSAYRYGGTYSMDWQPQEISHDTEIAEIKTHLMSLGCPEDILDDLTDEDLLDCRGALRVVTEERAHPFNQGRNVRETGTHEDGTNFISDKTEYDVKEMVITSIAVALPGAREQWKLIHHFRWTADPGYFGTESIQIWSAARTGSLQGWHEIGAYSGQVLYDKDGVSYVSPYVSLGREPYPQDDIFAEFSLPEDGENRRGYVAYTIEELNDGSVLASYINYTHGMTWAQYPVRTAKQTRMENGWIIAGAFKTAQDGMVFHPNSLVADGTDHASDS